MPPLCVIITCKGVIFDSINGRALHVWNGKFSECAFKGNIIKFCIAYIRYLNNPHIALIVCLADGNIFSDAVSEILQQANLVNDRRPRQIIVATLAQQSESPDIQYMYMPLDDTIFSKGIQHVFPVSILPDWHSRSNTVFWRGSQSGGATPTLRYQVVDKLFGVPGTDCRLLRGWDRGYEKQEYFGNHVEYSTFWNYKIFLIIDGNCIASNHTWGFAIGCVPMMITTARCWFQHLIEPFVHYIPVNPDLSDLMERIQWVHENDEAAKIIASNALTLSHHIFNTSFQKEYLINSLNNYSDAAYK